jgi:hypothetical protein
VSGPTEPDDIPDTESDPDRPSDPVEIMRQRAAATRADRDRSIAELREQMSAAEILETFGINLDELGD